PERALRSSTVLTLSVNAVRSVVSTSRRQVRWRGVDGVEGFVRFFHAGEAVRPGTCSPHGLIAVVCSAKSVCARARLANTYTRVRGLAVRPLVRPLACFARTAEAPMKFIGFALSIALVSAGCGNPNINHGPGGTGGGGSGTGGNGNGGNGGTGGGGGGGGGTGGGGGGGGSNNCGVQDFVLMKG